MTIIIETPAPPTRERLVLVPPDAVSRTEGGDELLTIRTANARDATPADLERAGYVTGDMLAEHVRIVWAAGQKAEPVGVAMLRKLKERAEKAEADVKWLRGCLRCPDHAMHDVPELCRLSEEQRGLEGLVETTCRERDAAIARAEKAERERDEALLRAHTGVVHYEILRQSGEEAARQRDEARAEVARLTALDRATDDELVDLYRKIYETHGGGTISVSHDDCRRAGLLAVAARVRQERCLVAQAVAMRAGVTISRTSERVPGTTGMWDVYVTRRPDVPGEHYAYGVPTAGVPATLARLLGEVSRG